MKPMGQRVREAGDHAVPMLTEIIIYAGAQACMAIEALEGFETGAPDLQETRRRLDNVVRLLMTGER